MWPSASTEKSHWDGQLELFGYLVSVWIWMQKEAAVRERKKKICGISFSGFDTKYLRLHTCKSLVHYWATSETVLHLPQDLTVLPKLPGFEDSLQIKN